MIVYWMWLMSSDLLNLKWLLILIDISYYVKLYSDR